MSWASPRNGHGSGRDDGKKTAKWLMRQAEKTDQQTVYLLNLLQEHRLEIEARDDVMRESSKVISKLQAENDSLKQQLQELELRNTLVAGDKRRQHTSPDADCLPDRQTISNGNFSSTVSEPPVDCQHRSAGQDSEVLRGGGGGGSSGHARSRCSTLLEAWARVRVTSQAGSSSEQSSNRSIDGLPTSTAVRQPCSRMPTSGQPQEPTSVPPRTLSPAVGEPCQQQEGPSHVPGSGRHTRAAAQQPTLSHREQHQHQLVQPTQLRPNPLPQHELQQQQDQQQRQQEPSTELKQLEVRFVTSTKEVDLSRAQWKEQQSQQSRPQQQPAHQPQRQQQSPPQPSPQQLQPALGAAYPAHLSAEVASLRCSLETAQQQTTEAQDKYLTCKKDLEVLTYKYNSLMLQKLEIEEEYNHLFHPGLDISVLRQAIPSVDSAMAELEERLQEVMDILASNQLEVEDTLRAHNATRRKWMTKLEDLQTQLADRDARLRKAEAQLLAAAVGTGMGPSGTGMGVGARMSQQQDGICGTTWRKREEETSSGDQVASPETRDNGLRRVASGGASMCGDNGGVDSSASRMAHHAFVGALSSS
ncbi:hypothetical protein Vretimale_526 [Volvox reticuliferus]|uniref:Uncharacterized protein n=1 Tax=Volvox reticuliferus TaxID=1737510 RepID=A0A8J4G144_9CHLO|nr:hypothetical protein Vretifemale_2428 [Volvox reticuliferus]GIL94333.1 hypothetical protein Vretimale_526 [Volvox reticuliferus]